MLLLASTCCLPRERASAVPSVPHVHVYAHMGGSRGGQGYRKRGTAGWARKMRSALGAAWPGWRWSCSSARVPLVHCVTTRMCCTAVMREESCHMLLSFTLPVLGQVAHPQPPLVPFHSTVALQHRHCGPRAARLFHIQCIHGSKYHRRRACSKCNATDCSAPSVPSPLCPLLSCLTFLCVLCGPAPSSALLAFTVVRRRLFPLFPSSS